MTRDYRVYAIWYPYRVQHGVARYFRMRLPVEDSPWVQAPRILDALLAVDGRPQGRAPCVKAIADA